MLKQFFISDSFAQETVNAAAVAPEFSITSLLPLILIFVVFYFLMVRPQSKKMKEHQNTVNNLKVGNKVITTGGIIGTVTEVLTKENQVEVEIADGVKVKILKNYVADLVRDEVAKVKKEATKKGKK
jgi:preprotein translocase subunit YajC